MHRHDAAELLRASDARFAEPELDRLEEQAAFALMLESAFALKLKDEEPLALTLVGAEAEGERVYVYQEIEGTFAALALEASQRLFSDAPGRTVAEVFLEADDRRIRRVAEPNGDWIRFDDVVAIPEAK